MKNNLNIKKQKLDLVSPFRKAYRFLLFLWFKYIKGMNNLGNNVAFGARVLIDNPSSVTLGDNVTLSHDIWLNAHGNKKEQKIIIGANSSFRMRCMISAEKKVVIGKNVLFAPNVFVTDHIHAYDNISIPIKDQGVSKIAPVFIGSGTWIGINAVILPGVTIGKNCVIGANSVVTKSISDYTVAVGAPAKIVKIFDERKRMWIRNKRV